MTDSSEHLEQEIEAHRAGVEHTLERLKRRMSMDQIVDDVGQFVGVEDVRGTLRAAGRQVQENPLALGLIGAGLAWLMLGSGSSRKQDADEDARSGSGRSRYSGAWPAGQGREDWHDEDGSGSGVASKVGDAIGQKAGAVKEYAASAADRVRETVDDGSQKIRRTVQPVIHRMEDNPLILGSVAVVVGAVIGSALPRTRVEDRLLGPQKQKLLDEARTMSRDLRDQAVDAARAGFSAAVQTARDEGLVPSGGTTVAEKVQHVAEAAIGEAKSHLIDADATDEGDGASRARARGRKG